MEHTLIARDVNIRISKVDNDAEPIVASQSDSLLDDVKASCMQDNIKLNPIKRSETATDLEFKSQIYVKRHQKRFTQTEKTFSKTENAQYRCINCEKLYSTLGGANKHFRIAHMNTVSTPKPIEPIVASQCNSLIDDVKASSCMQDNFRQKMEKI